MMPKKFVRVSIKVVLLVSSVLVLIKLSHSNWSGVGVNHIHASDSDAPSDVSDDSVSSFSLDSERKNHSRLVNLTNLPLEWHLEVKHAKSQTHKLVQIMQRHKEMWESYYLGGASKVLDSREEDNFLWVLNLLENSYPFNRKYYKSVWDLYSSYQGRGIVMTTGNGYTKYDHELM